MAYFNQNQNNRQDDRGSYGGGGGGGRRDFGGRGGQRGDRRMYPAVCDKCGRDCQVPFRPDGSKPIYCSNCFEKKQGGFDQKRDSYGGGRRQFSDRGSSQGQKQNQNNEVLASINSKLAQILELMRKGDNTSPRQERVKTKVKEKLKVKKKAKVKPIIKKKKRVKAK